MLSSELPRVGIDLGGTKIEGVVLSLKDDGSHDVILRERVATERDRGYDAILDCTSTLINSLCYRAGAPMGELPVGVGMPGNVTSTGLVKNSNTTCLNGRPFREDLVRALRRPIAFDNDANCFALAESCFGAARPYREGIVFGVILGTGVGGGIVIQGRRWPGLHGIAGEWGHHAVWPERETLCYCGERGCVELYASGPAIEKAYAMVSGTRAPLSEIATRTRHDSVARRCIEDLLDTLARGLANVIDILDPTAIVLGGGVSNLDVLYTELHQRVAKYVFNDELLTPILKHELGDSAGVLGAALLGL